MASRIRDPERRLADAVQHERALSDIVNAAYGLTPEEVALMWRTAPPRMPLDPGDEMRRALTIADYQQTLP